MAHRGDSSYQSNYGDSRRFNQPISSLFDMKHSSQDGYQGERHLSHGSSTSMYGRGSHSQSFDESYQNPSSAWGEGSRGSPGESAQGSGGYRSQKRISDLFDTPSTNKHNQFGSSQQKNYHQSHHNQLEQPFQSNYEKIEQERYKDSHQGMVNPPFEQSYGTTERESYRQSYQERNDQPFQQNYQSTRSGDYKGTQFRDSFRYTASNSNNDNFQHESRSSFKNFNQGGFESTHEGSNGNFGNQRNVFRGNSYRGEFQSRRQRGQGLSGKTHSAYRGQQSHGRFESRDNQVSRQPFTKSFRNRDTEGKMKTDLKHKEHNPEFLHSSEEELPTEEHNGDEDESDSDEEAERIVKINPVNIDKALKEKYKFYPPSAEEMGTLFEGLVIFHYHKSQKIKIENNLFVVICDSFRRSSQFDDLQVEDGFQQGDKFRKFCTLRFNDMMMARGVSENGNIKEARVWAAVELINKLAMTCYTLKVKNEYFEKAGVQNILSLKELPGVFRVVPEEEVPDVASACKYIDDFFSKEDSDCELVFTNPTFFHPIRVQYSKKNGEFEARGLGTSVAVFRKRTPQYWRDKILASGKMENEKYTLTPPLGLGKNILENFDITKVVAKLKNFPPAVPSADKADIYDPQRCPKILKAKPPWAKRGPKQFGRSNEPGIPRTYGKMSKSNKNNMKRISKAIQEGKPLESVKAFSFLNKRKKKMLKTQFGV